MIINLSIDPSMYVYIYPSTFHLSIYLYICTYLSDFLSKLGPYSNAEFDYMDGENGSVDPKHETQVSISSTSHFGSHSVRVRQEELA